MVNRPNNAGRRFTRTTRSNAVWWYIAGKAISTFSMGSPRPSLPNTVPTWDCRDDRDT